MTSTASQPKARPDEVSHVPPRRRPPVALVPSRLFVGLAAALVPILAGVAVALPELAPMAVFFLVLLAITAAFDALRSRARVTRLQARWEGPFRLNLGRPAIASLRLEHLPPRLDSLRVGIAWPPHQMAAGEILEVALPAGAAHVRLEWPCLPLQRGPIHLDRCHVECGSRWGFWELHVRPELQVQLRVYPDLSAERRRLAALFLPHASAGWRQERMLGQGREFEQLRDYVPGDGWEDIHWKATAKRGRPITKLYQLERTQEVYVLLDYSRLSARPAHDAGAGPGETVGSAVDPARAPVNELEPRLNAALMLGLAAQRQGDRFGFVAFASRTRVFLRAATGAAHFQRCQDALHALAPEAASPNLGELFATLRQRLRRRALLVFLTALDDPLVAEEFERGVSLLTRQHLVLVHQIAPRALAPILHGGEPSDLEDAARALARHFQWKTLRGTASRLHRLGAAFTLVSASDLAATTVTRYVQLKRQQRL